MFIRLAQTTSDQRLGRSSKGWTSLHLHGAVQPNLLRLFQVFLSINHQFPATSVAHFPSLLQLLSYSLHRATFPLLYDLPQHRMCTHNHNFLEIFPTWAPYPSLWRDIETASILWSSISPRIAYCCEGKGTQESESYASHWISQEGGGALLISPYQCLSHCGTKMWTKSYFHWPFKGSLRKGSCSDTTDS